MLSKKGELENLEDRAMTPYRINVSSFFRFE
jgi:hypothetical protein